MLIYIIYIVVFLILAFVIFVAVKAINKGLEAKQNKKFNLNENINIDAKYQNIKLSNEINELKKLHSKGALSDKEFKKAKEKILI